MIRLLTSASLKFLPESWFDWTCLATGMIYCDFKLALIQVWVIEKLSLTGAI